MTLSKKIAPGLFVVASAALAFSAPAYSQTGAGKDAALASDTLSDGDTARAIQMLRAELRDNPTDPAIMINLGIAQAQAGDEVRARELFRAAMASREVLELETADGRTTDSRRLARNALAMLERGEFRPATTQGDRFTLRD
jgi:hypothetical protein